MMTIINYNVQAWRSLLIAARGFNDSATGVAPQRVAHHVIAAGSHWLLELQRDRPVVAAVRECGRPPQRVEAG